ncbi:hypothetical protein G7B40_008975 [Aetokthonos hydrillicola Thurmond2011]|jgi:hypothetical protein|uniref:Uncharacterized protein n=1 Tax=Aetokthonos hydrillicola Thurmond2011 TaxID=2712845 RepID=A0AAP5I4V4_9CYAN|nr:hypothetical protein [Aetokthonos hydrillicola]MBO3457618.1 hypothetical protein [Aetokthonos hydrillicola CCALA 1050]MBW4587896.1 hypothetical protein [Aetokthonos hydrillicola CCALA 1050]MDR9894700.1 hypothetical protein [Aetokthonos hydrillicola Thurmond2011]
MAKCVSELYDLYPNSDIYIIGTGASLRAFPISFLENKITIGLNMAWKTVPVRYSITIHPELSIPEFLPEEKPRPEITWVTKYHKTKALVSPEQFKYAEDNFYFFETEGRVNTQAPNQPSDAGRILDWVRKPTENKLYLWTSIAQSGVNLAANMGAKNIVLVGCDNCALLNNHHAHKQHTRWRDAAPNQRYKEYYEGLAEMRPVLRERGVNLMSLTPFLSLESPEFDFERLCKELNQPKYLASGADISPKLNYTQYYIKELKKIIKRMLIPS